MTFTRQFWVIAHRWAGLTIALFLCVAGLTGSLIAWNHELGALTAPAFYHAEPPTPNAKPLDPYVLRERVEASTGARIDRMPLHFEPAEAIRFYPAVRPGQPALGYREVAINPYTGEEQGRRNPSDLTEGWHNIMPFIYALHYKLALGEWMAMAFGVAALIWTLDCFVGFYLTLPRTPVSRWRRWGKAWNVRTPVTNRYKLNVDLHTVTGLWLWPVLLVFAWSSVGFNLRDEIYNPVMTAMTGKPDMFTTIPEPENSNDKQNLRWPEALTIGRSHATDLARLHNFKIEREGVLIFNRAAGLWQYRVRSNRDVWGKYEATRILFHDSDGRLFNFEIPSGHHVRETADNWLFGLHMGLVLGLPYRIFVTALGLLVTMLSVTGVVIWMKKRSARIAHGRRRDNGLTTMAVLQPAE